MKYLPEICFATLTIILIQSGVSGIGLLIAIIAMIALGSNFN